jgi:surface antigen
MRRLSLTSTALLLLLASAADAACYLPAEIEADQAIRLGVELKVVGEICKEPSYAAFSERNHDTLAAYQEILAEHLGRESGAADVASYLARLETDAKERAARSPSFCAEAFDLVATAGGMRAEGLRVYAAAKADAARRDYALCSAPDGSTPREASPLDAAPGKEVPTVTASAAPAPAHSGGADEDDLVTALAATSLARMLDPADRQRLKETTQQTLETAGPGQTVGWRNPFSRNAGTVVAAGPFKNAGSQWCRRFEQSIMVEGQMRRGGGTACRRSDGSWEIEP